MRSKALALLALLLAACNIEGTPRPTEGANLEVFPDTLALRGGGSARLFLTLPEEFRGELTLGLEGAPAGVSLSPETVEAKGSQLLLTLSADETTPPGEYDLTLRVSKEGSAEGKAPLALLVYEGKTFTVDTTSDTADANPGDGKCADRAGACSLRAAVMEANALGLPAEITLPADTYTLTEEGGLELETEITLKGAGRGRTFIEGRGPLLQVYPGRTVELKGLTLRAQNPSGTPDTGGVLYSAGWLTLEDVVVTGGKAGYGGGIHNSATGLLVLKGVTLKGNEATEAGGGLYNEGILFLIESKVEGNTAPKGGGVYSAGVLSAIRLEAQGNTAEEGGGLYLGPTLLDEDIPNPVPPTAELTWSELAGNEAQRGGGLLLEEGSTARISSSTFRENEGGALHTAGLLTLLNTTLSGNRGAALYSAGETSLLFSTIVENERGISSPSGTLRLRGTILQSCEGELESKGYNLLEDPEGCRFSTQRTDLTGVEALLEPLEEEDPVWVHRPKPDSPALDQIPPSTCTDLEGNPVKEDALGTKRPRNSACDIGAVEY